MCIIFVVCSKRHEKRKYKHHNVELKLEVKEITTSREKNLMFFFTKTFVYPQKKPKTRICQKDDEKSNRLLLLGIDIEE